ncbi:TetR family transcriptional regulator [Polymorphospora rubra]|uniref:TetR family transcriptional regulator n=1 Tax=Polymorphospora rubra TaxID=338584 RepID=UPI0033DB91A4
MDPTAPATDTRSRILRAAADLFVRKGYQRTSLREIADSLRLTKAAILYHFPTKEHLAAELVEPFVADLEAVAAYAATQPPGPRRWAMIEGWLDTLLKHRAPLGMLVNDIAILNRNSVYRRILAVATEANELVAGPDADQRERVRATQAIAMVSDPIVFYTDVDTATLREDMLDGVHRLLEGGPRPARADAGPARTGARPRRGRPPALSDADVDAARAMHAAGTHTVDEIAAAFGVGRATLYRHLNRD